MGRSAEGHVCEQCGAVREVGARCLACGAKAHAIELKVLPPGEGAAAPPAIKLVRQLKMPTVRHLVSAPADTVEALPDALRSVEDAVDAGDFAGANELMDQALAAVLDGPGDGRRPLAHGYLPRVLWVSCGILLLLFVIACCADWSA